MEDNGRIHLFICGIVQGVFFRAHTRDIARKLNLTGWVKNLPDGRVEVVAEGPQSALQNLIDWCRKGPPGARVDNIEVNWEDYTGDFKGFEIRYGI